MEANVAILERIIRIILGALIFSLPFLGYNGPFFLPFFFVVGGYFVLTGALGYCVIYKLIGYSSLRKNFW